MHMLNCASLDTCVNASYVSVCVYAHILCMCVCVCMVHVICDELPFTICQQQPS